MMIRRVLFAFMLAGLSLAAMAQAVAPVATLDRSRVGTGETVTLNIAVADDSDQAPDLSALSADFDVLGTSTNRSLSIVNGRREARTILGIALRPRHEGHLTVPALAIGQQHTQPVSLDVDASPGQGVTSADKPVFVEGKVEPAQAYVGQQIDYTLRLYFSLNLADGQLGDPSAEGAEVRRVGQDANFQAQRGARRYSVVERHYAIFPQHAGTLEIQPSTFQGTAVDPSDAGSFFGTGSPINAVSERLRVDVRARPASATDGAWIPAREVRLSLDGLPADGKARVGQPMTLTMHLDATGMPFEALPALSLPTLDGADVYPDKAVTGGGTSGPWITGRRQQGFAVVPTHTGILHIPATTLHWWNVVTDKAEVATLPAHDIDVGAGVGGATVKPAGVSTVAPVAAPSPVAVAVVAGGMPWRGLFLGALVLWLVTLVAWIVFGRRRVAGPVTPSSAPRTPSREAPLREEFLSATRRTDVATMERTLLAWARVLRPSIRSLGALSTALRDGPQRVAIAHLQRARFADGELDGATLRDAFAPGFNWVPAHGDEGDDGLPPLYPR